MLANINISLRDHLSDAVLDPNAQEKALLAAGTIIARYIAEIPFMRENGAEVVPLHLKPEILTSKETYPRLKFVVDKARLEDAIDMLRAIDMKAPSMECVKFNQLVCCNEETCMIVINAGAPLVCEFADIIAKKTSSSMMPTEKTDAPTPNGGIR